MWSFCLTSRMRKKSEMKTSNSIPFHKNGGRCGLGGITRIDGHFPRPLSNFQQWALEKKWAECPPAQFAKSGFFQKWPLDLLDWGRFAPFPTLPTQKSYKEM